MYIREIAIVHLKRFEMNFLWGKGYHFDVTLDEFIPMIYVCKMHTKKDRCVEISVSDN